MVNEPVLVDTGPLIALYSEEDAHHCDCYRKLFDRQQHATQAKRYQIRLMDYILLVSSAEQVEKGAVFRCPKRPKFYELLETGKIIDGQE